MVSSGKNNEDTQKAMTLWQNFTKGTTWVVISVIVTLLLLALFLL